MGFLKLKQKQAKSTQNQNIKIPVQHAKRVNKKGFEGEKEGLIL